LNYKNLNDYELVYEVRENSEEAYNAIFEKYAILIRKMASNYCKSNKKIRIEFDDLVQEGYVGLIQAIDNYNEKNCLFYTFAILCIKREMERLIKYYSRNKQTINSSAVSLNIPLDSDEDMFLEDIISDGHNMEEEVISDINVSKLIDLKYSMPLEMSYVYELRMNKFNNDEISTLLDIPKKKVEKYVYKIRKQVNNYYYRLT